jgi:type I restriction enzyme S subunit
MDTKALRQKILDLAIRGKLVPQDPNDEPASVLLERIRAEKQQMVKEGKLKAKDIKNDTVIFKGDDNLHYEQFADGTVKYIEDEIPFDLPEGWEWCRLQTLCVKEIKRGKAPKYEEKSDTLVFAQKCNTKAGYIDISKAKFLDQSTLKKYTDEDYLSYNDIIINSTGTGTLGRIGIYMESDDAYGIKIVPDSHITIVRAMSSEMNSRYVYYFLKYHQSYFENSGVGSTNQKELKPEVISTFLVAVPPIEEQNNIVSKIDIANNYSFDLDNKKEQLKELISAIKSKILDLAIRGKLVPQDPNDEPASILLERIRAEKEELIKQGKIKRDKKESVIFKGDDNSYYDDIPENWCISCLSEITSPLHLNDGDWILSDNMVPFGEIKLIQLGSVGFLQYNDKGFKYLSNEMFKELNCTEIFSGYMLINRIISDKMCSCILPEIDGKKITTVDTCWVAPNDKWYNLKYLMYAISSPHFQSLVMMYSSGTTRRRISKLNLVKLPLAFPPLPEQARIVKAIETAFAQLDEISNSIA